MSNDPDLIEPVMKTYLVTLTGEAREIYSVEAASADDAAAYWATDGSLYLIENEGMEVVSVEVDE